jgi:hypothetical protein
MPRNPIPAGLLAIDVEREHHRRHDPKGIVFGTRKRRGFVPIVEVLVRVV